MNFASNSVFVENPKLMDLGLLPAHTADKLKSIFAPDTKSGGLTDHTDWLASRHRIEEITADRVSEAKAYSDYIKNSEFETMNVFGRENNYGPRLNENNSGTQLNENIQMPRPDKICK